MGLEFGSGGGWEFGRPCWDCDCMVYYDILIIIFWGNPPEKGKREHVFFLGGWSFKQIRIHHVWAWAMAIESLVVHSKDKTIGNASISRISGRMGDGLSLGSLTIATAHLGCGLCMALLHCCPWIHSKRDFFYNAIHWPTFRTIELNLRKTG